MEIDPNETLFRTWIIDRHWTKYHNQISTILGVDQNRFLTINLKDKNTGLPIQIHYKAFPEDEDPLNAFVESRYSLCIQGVVVLGCTSDTTRKPITIKKKLLTSISKS